MKIKNKMIKVMNKVNKAMATAVASLAALYYTPVFVFAGGEGDDIVSKIDRLKELVINVAQAVAQAAGMIFLVNGLVEFGIAYSAHDTASQSTALKKIIGGLIIASVSTLVAIFA